jgi:nucleotide-binding universal stress UspA family protein
MSVRIRRIVVAIDASPASVAALEVAAELAVAWETEVLGLFVEDINLLRLGSLPFAREVGGFSAARRRISGVEVEQHLRIMARHAQEALATVARRLGIRTSFRIARGRVTEQLLEQISSDDLFCLGVRSWSVTGRTGLGSTARAIAVGAQGRILILPHGARAAGPAAVVYDGSRSATEALETALAFVGGRGQDLRVFCVGPTEKKAQHLARQAAEGLGARGSGIHFRQIKPADVRHAARAALGLGANALVVPGGGNVLSDTAIDALISDLPGPVLVVRMEDAKAASQAGG